MTTYHLERRTPRHYETYVLEAITTGFPAPGMVTTAVDGFPTAPRYVITPDRPRGEHPEALLIRVNGELYGRTPTSSGQPSYVSCDTFGDFQYPEDITEWEDVYDEVPDPEPEPKHPTAAVIRVTAVGPNWCGDDTPFYAVWDPIDRDYTTPIGNPLRPDLVAAWDDIVTDTDTDEEVAR